jgi:hypothetical protein
MGKNTGPDKHGDILRVEPGLINIPIIKFIGQDEQKKYNKDKRYQTKGHKQLFLRSFPGNALMGRMDHFAEESLFYPVVAKMAKFLFGLNNDAVN